ncbi:MAG: DUF3892 domain-containing protein [Elusimicrobiaceae bacterium]|nr:DUF3892 domain-containing protein [Elusimicrobiaceae bacterium]
MAYRITHVRKDKEDDIIAVKLYGGVVETVPQVVGYIERGLEYYVQEVTPPADVHVVTLPSGRKYIRTDADRYSRNNLDNLPLF